MKKIPQLSDLADDEEPASAEAAPGDGPGAADAPRAETAGATAPFAPSDDRAAPDERATPPSGAPLDTPPGAPPAVGGAGGAGRQGSGSGRGSGSGKVSRSRARRYARERALQALYQWDLASSESSDVRRQFIDRQDMSRVDVEYFERLFRGVSHDVERVDESLARALDRPIGDLDPIERAVLRVAAFELAEVPETPARVVINEGVEITKRFGADNGHRYVNGVLDRLAGLARPREMRRG